MIELAAGGASDVGRVRSVNQDSWVIGDGLWAVADGMGGHQGGEVASRMAIDSFQAHMLEPTSDAVVEAAQQANAAVHQRSSQDAKLRGMGTTLCAMALVGLDGEDQELAVINIGDSRCYQWRDGLMTQITRDHSLVEDMREAGQITEAEAAVHPHRNIVTRALGIQPDVEVDEFFVAPKTGDRYILCSDGLFNELSNEKIGATLRRLVDPQDACSELVRLANEAGGRDNVTCVVVDIVDDDGSAERASAAGRDAIRRRTQGHDVAGIASATTPDVDDDEASEKPTGFPEKTETKPKLKRATWRTLLFVLLFLIILGLAALAVGWYSRGTYFVGFGSHEEVVVFKGRPEQVLWFKPTIAKRTGVYKAQVPEAQRDDIAAGKQVDSIASAKTYLNQMRAIICSNLRNGARLAPPAPGAPTTTIPRACADLTMPPGKSTTTTSTTTSPPPSQPATTVASTKRTTTTHP